MTRKNLTALNKTHTGQKVRLGTAKNFMNQGHDRHFLKTTTGTVLASSNNQDEVICVCADFNLNLDISTL